MKKLKKIPKFKSHAQEDSFWKEHDSTDFIDWSKANKEDVPYQSLMKILLARGVSNLRK